MRIDPSFTPNLSHIQSATHTIKQEIAGTSRLSTFSNSFQPIKELSNTTLDKLLEASCLGFCQEQSGPTLSQEAVLLQAACDYLAQNPIFIGNAQSPPLFLQAAENVQEQSKCKNNSVKIDLITNKIQTLSVGESYFIEAGLGQNALLVRITNTAQGYDIFFYDASRGSEKRQGGAVNPEGTRVFPYVQFTHVTKDELFVPEDPTLFFELLFEKAKQSPNERRPSFEECLNSICLPFFHKKRKVDDLLKERKELLISVEKAQPATERFQSDPPVNSAIKSFHCLFLDVLAAIPAKKMYEPQNGVTEGSPGEGSPGRGNAPLGKKDLAGTVDVLADQPTAKKWALAQDFFTLLYCFSAWEASKNQKTAEQTAYRLDLAIKRFLEQLSDHHQRIPENDFISAVATMTEMQEQLEKYLNRPKKAYLSPPPEPAPLNKNVHSERLDALFTLPTYPHSVGNAVCKSVSVQSNLGKECHWSGLKALLEQAPQYMDPQDPVGTIIQYQCLIGNLRHLKAAKVDITPEEALEIQQALSGCFQLFIEAVHSQKGELGQLNLNAMMETSLLQYLLTAQIAPEIKEYGIDFEHYRKVLAFSYHLSQDHEAMAHTNELLEFLTKLSSKKVLFTFLDPREWTLGQWIRGDYPEADFHLQGLPKDERILLENKQSSQTVKKFIHTCSVASPQQGDHPRLAAFRHLKQSVLWGVELTLVKHFLPGQEIKIRNSKEPNCISAPEFMGNKGWLYDSRKRIPSISGLKYCWENKEKGYGVIPLLIDPERPPAGFSKECADTYKTEIIKSGRRSENEFLSTPPQNAFHRYLVSLCAEGAQASVILQDLVNELAGLPKDEVASILFLLFKTFSNGTEVKSPLFEQLRTDPHIVARLGLLVGKVFGVWSVDPEMKGPLLTVLRLYGQLCYSGLHCNPEQAGQFDLEKMSLYIKWVNETSSDPEVSPLCLLTKSALLLAPRFTDLSTEQKVDLFLTCVEMKSKEDRFSGVMEMERKKENSLSNIVDLKKKEKERASSVSEAFYLMLKRYAELQDNWRSLFADADELGRFTEAAAKQVEPIFIPSGNPPAIKEPLEITLTGQRGIFSMSLPSLEVRLSTGELWCTAELKSVVTKDLERLRPGGFFLKTASI